MTQHLQTVLPTYEAALWQSQAYRALRMFMDETLSRHQLSMSEWSLLGHTYDQGEVRASDLAQILSVELPLVTKLVNRMEQNGLVQRTANQQDRRTKLVSLTPQGKEMVERIELGLRESLRDYLIDVSPPNLSVYLSVLQTIARKLSK